MINIHTACVCVVRCSNDIKNTLLPLPRFGIASFPFSNSITWCTRVSLCDSSLYWHKGPRRVRNLSGCSSSEQDRQRRLPFQVPFDIRKDPEIYLQALIICAKEVYMLFSPFINLYNMVLGGGVKGTHVCGRQIIYASGVM